MAAIFNEEGDEAAHAGEIGGEDDLTALPPRSHQASAAELGEMAGERVMRHPQGTGDLASRQPLRRGLDQEAEGGEAGFLRQSGKAIDRAGHVHMSGLIDIWDAAQAGS